MLSAVVATAALYAAACLLGAQGTAARSALRWVGVVAAVTTLAAVSLLLVGNVVGEPCGPGSVADIARTWSVDAFEPGMRDDVRRCLDLARGQVRVALVAQWLAAGVAAVGLGIIASSVARERSAQGARAARA